MTALLDIHPFNWAVRLFHWAALQKGLNANPLLSALLAYGSFVTHPLRQEHPHGLE